MVLDRDLFTGLAALAPPSYVEELAFETIRDEILATVTQQLPDWDESPDDPLYKATENYAYREFVLRQSFNAGYRAGLLAYAAGADLDQLAVLLGVERQDDEDDDGLRSRIPIALRGLSVGTEVAYDALARVAGVEVGVTQIAYEVGNTGVDVKVYGLDFDGAALSSSDRATIRDFLRESAHHHLGDTVAVPATTSRAYTITAAIVYDAAIADSVAVEAAARAAVYGLIRVHTRPGAPIAVSLIVDALVVRGVTDVTVSGPASDDDGDDGEVPRCAQDATDVTLTLTAVA